MTNDIFHQETGRTREMAPARDAPKTARVFFLFQNSVRESSGGRSVKVEVLGARAVAVAASSQIQPSNFRGLLQKHNLDKRTWRFN